MPGPRHGHDEDLYLASSPSPVDVSAKSIEQPLPDSFKSTNLESQASSEVPAPAPDMFLTEAFHKADTDGDGKLSHEELKDLIQSLGFGLEEDEEKLNKFVLEVDADNDGTIDLDEFQFIVDKMNSKTTMTFEQQLRETFELYDADGSGGLDQEEITQLMATLGHDLTDEEVSDMIAAVDEDGNGDIDYDEFVAMFKGIKVSGAGGDKQKKVEKKNEISIKRGTIFDDAKQHVSFGRVFRFVTWLYSERKMILLACSHFVATMVIWAHFALIKFQQQENAVPEGAPRYWAKRLIPPIEFGSMHAILFQMALIPFTMSRYTIATFSGSKLNKYLPLDKALRVHIHLGYTMVSIVFAATIVFFVFFGLSCAEGEEAFCDKFNSEIMITGYCILGCLLLMAGTAFFRHSIPYELFYGVHFLFFAMYALAIAHTLDIAQRSGKKDRSQTFKWFAAPLIYYICDYAAMWFNQRFKTRVTGFTAVEGHEGSKMLILKMKRPPLFMFQPGQYAFLQVQSIDKSWHPFSIASHPDSNTVEFYIEVYGEGSWTECLWTKLQNRDKHQKIVISLLGPYGTALVKDSSYTNIIAIGTGTGVVPNTSLLKQHVHRMTLMEPSKYFEDSFQQKKRNISIMGAQEDKQGSIVSHLVSALKGFVNPKHRKDLDEALKAKTADSLKSHARRESIRSSMRSVEVGESQSKPSFRRKAELKMATFNATRSMYGKTILAFLTLYSVAVFSLDLSWSLTTADISTSMINALQIMTVLLHAIFFFCSFFIWDRAGLQPYLDAAISIILPFADWYYKVQSSLSSGQIITLSLLNGYITFRLYQKTLATESEGQHTLKESVEHLRFIWSVRQVKVARQLLPEINEIYELLVKQWGEDYAREVLDINIYITSKDRSETASFRAQIRDMALFKSRKVVFIRSKLAQIIEEYVVKLIERQPAYSSTLLAFCGGPNVSSVIAEARSTVELLAAATGYSSHRLDFVSESYGGAKKIEEVTKNKLSSDNLWDAVRQENIQIVHTKRVQSVFEDEDEADGSNEELMKEYKSSERNGLGLRHRSKV